MSWLTRSKASSGARDRLGHRLHAAPGPAVLGPNAHHLFGSPSISAGMSAAAGEIFEIGGGEDQHLAAAVVAK